MSLVMALVARDSLVVVADRRQTMMHPAGTSTQWDGATKLAILPFASGRRQVLVGTTGAAGYAAVILSELAATVDQPMTGRGMAQLAPAQSAADVAMRVHHLAAQLYDQAFPGVPAPGTSQGPSRPPLGFVVAGWEPDAGGAVHPALWLLDGGSTFFPNLVETRWTALGLFDYAAKLLSRLHQPGSAEGALALASFVLEEVSAQDGRVGGGALAAVLPAAGGGRWCTEQELRAASERAGQARAQLRGQFA